MSKRQTRADKLRSKYPEDAKLSNKRIIARHGEKPVGREKKQRRRK